MRKIKCFRWDERIKILEADDSARPIPAKLKA